MWKILNFQNCFAYVVFYYQLMSHIYISTTARSYYIVKKIFYYFLCHLEILDGVWKYSHIPTTKRSFIQIAVQFSLECMFVHIYKKETLFKHPGGSISHYENMQCMIFWKNPTANSFYLFLVRGLLARLGVTYIYSIASQTNYN